MVAAPHPTDVGEGSHDDSSGITMSSLTSGFWNGFPSIAAPEAWRDQCSDITDGRHMTHP